MEKSDLKYSSYMEILDRELVPAMGCTEPIAIAFAAAKATELLKVKPEKIILKVSGNIIKNVKSVIVPNTLGMKGLESAVLVGALYGDASKGLEVISSVTDEEATSLRELMTQIDIEVYPLSTCHVLDIEVTAYKSEHTSFVHIQDEHTNIIELSYDDAPISITSSTDSSVDSSVDYTLLTVDDIVDFASTCDLDDVKNLLDTQITYNKAIAVEGLHGHYGASIGRLLMKQDGCVRTKAKALAAAGSDARMNGCNLPVVINSGSGNQGLTASLPVIAYAEHYEKSDENLYRSLLVSNLVTLHLKYGIGRLSAYCGAVSAGAGAGAGIAYLLTKDVTVIRHTIVNALAITSGIICDGAKASCAAKIAMAVEAGIMGFEMYEEGNEFLDGDGIVSKGVENTINNVSYLGHYGMKDTDEKIIEIMSKCYS